MTAPGHTIVLSPLGHVDTGLIGAIGREVRRVFGVATETVPLLDDVLFALDIGRDQYHSTAILEKLTSHAPDGTLKVLGITEVDLFIPILTYVYGEAQLGGRAGIISTHRLHEGLPSLDAETAFHCRAAKEAVHELGHTFKLRHCKEKSCIMHYCRSIRDVDRKSEDLCRYCGVLLNDELRRLRGR